MSSALDDLARRLAEPMPRRRALGVVAAAALSTLVPLGRPRSARADGHCPSGWTSCGNPSAPNHSCCEPDLRCCPTMDGGLCFERQYTCCSSRYWVDEPPGGNRYDVACGPGEECVRGRCRRKCPSGRERCKDRCCERSQECVDGRCRRRCPAGRTRCGRKCCPKGHRCADARRGVCRRCRRGHSACGGTCCGRRSFCCDPAKGLCCPKKGGSCCPSSSGKGQMCCKDGTTCARPVNVTASGSTHGVDHKARHLCCPRDRYIERYRSCCPPGHVSLGGALVVPAGGGGGMCCRRDKLCGSTCCSTGSTAPELEQTCCGGACRNLRVDPQNCGTCGNVCPAGHECRDGTCVPA